MKLKSITEHRMFHSALGAALTVLCGLALWQIPLGEAWRNASFDYLFRFTTRGVTNSLVLVFMDNEAHEQLGQARGEWDRALHTNLLHKLADDGARMVVLDLFFGQRRDSEVDDALAAAMRRHEELVLMAKQADASNPGFLWARPLFPAEPFLEAAKTNWGVAWLDPDLDLIVRKHWPFPAPGPYESLPWRAAGLAGARLPAEPQEQWLRFYRPHSTWTGLSYSFALNQGPGFFREKIVFVGNKPGTTVPYDEEDEFRVPHSRWTGQAVGGVEILATEFLNLVNNEWLRRPAWWIEIPVLIVTGLLLGWFLNQMRPARCCGTAVVAALVAMSAAVLLSHFTNYWFPWLVIAGGQAPCAVLCALALRSVRRLRGERAMDYEIIEPPFAEGAYGTVALARNAVGQWQALKTIYRAKFGNDASPYEREFRGITRYKPISDKHPGLLRVDFVSRMKPEGYFYYVMELGDSQTAGWTENPVIYKPCDLEHLRAEAANGRLPVSQCVRIGVVLADTLDFLHREGVTHRDIKPRNIIFVNGHPRLADVGLVAEIRARSGEDTQVGTPGYMPPAPEPVGTAQADIYGLGMVLYVISTGRNPAAFPELSATLMQKTGQDFVRLNGIILRACHPDLAQRYATAAEMHADLVELQKLVSEMATETSVAP